MGRLKPTDFILYRARIWVSIAAVIVFSAVMLLVTTQIPGGLADVELTSATQSGNLSWRALAGDQPDNILFLPYHILQFISMHAFGVSAFSIKLPSLLLSAGSLVILFGLLYVWFRKNVAIIGVGLAASVTTLLVLSQQGTPMITYLFWAVALLYTASMQAYVTRFRPLWFMLTALIAGLSLYSPYNIYIVAALIITASIHPHARFAVFKQPLWALISATALFGLLLTPLSLALIKHPQLWLQLIGADHGFSWQRTLIQIRMYTDFFTPRSGLYPQPVYGLSIVFIVLIGLYRVFTTKYTAKSYIVTIMLIFGLIVTIVSSLSAGFLLFPVLLLTAFGIDYLIRKWYGLFPNNPYARLVGILVISIVTIGLGLAGIQRFEIGYHYDSEASSVYPRDVSLLSSAISREKNSHIILVVPESKKSFYEVYSRLSRDKNHTLSVTNTVPASVQNKTLIASREKARSVTLIPRAVVVSASAENADRFYIFEKSQK